MKQVKQTIAIVVFIVLLFAILLDWWTMKQQLWSLRQELLMMAKRPTNEVVIPCQYPVFELPKGFDYKNAFDASRKLDKEKKK